MRFLTEMHILGRGWLLLSLCLQVAGQSPWSIGSDIFARLIWVSCECPHLVGQSPVNVPCKADQQQPLRLVIISTWMGGIMTQKPTVFMLTLITVCTH